MRKNIVGAAVGAVLGVIVLAMCVTGVIAKVRDKGHREYIKEIFTGNSQQVEQVQEPTQDENTIETENAVIKFNF